MTKSSTPQPTTPDAMDNNEEIRHLKDWELDQPDKIVEVQMALSEVLVAAEAADAKAEALPTPTLSAAFDGLASLLDHMERAALNAEIIAGRLDGRESAPPLRPAKPGSMIDQLVDNVIYAAQLTHYINQCHTRTLERLG